MEPDSLIRIATSVLYVGGTLILLSLALLFSSKAFLAAVRTWQTRSTQDTEEATPELSKNTSDKLSRISYEGHVLCAYCDNPATKFAPSIVEERGALQLLSAFLPIEMIPPRYRRGSVKFPSAKYCEHHGAMAEHEIDMWLAREQNDLVRFYRDRSIRAAKFQTDGLQASLDAALDEGQQLSKRLRSRRSNVTALPVRSNNS